MSDCAICRRTAPDRHHACPLHAEELLEWLAELPRQAALLEAFVEPAAGPAQGRLGGTGRAHAPIPVDLRVLTLLGPGQPVPPPDPYGDAAGPVPIGALVRGWADFIASEHKAVTRDPYGTERHWPCDGAHPARGATITGWCTWLTAYLPYALTRPWVGEMHRQIGDVLAVIRDLTHVTPPRHHKPAPCPACKALALVTVRGTDSIRCEACGHRLTPAAYEKHAGAVLQAAQAG